MPEPARPRRMEQQDSARVSTAYLRFAKDEVRDRSADAFATGSRKRYPVGVFSVPSGMTTAALAWQGELRLRWIRPALRCRSANLLSLPAYDPSSRYRTAAVAGAAAAGTDPLPCPAPDPTPIRSTRYTRTVRPTSVTTTAALPAQLGANPHRSAFRASGSMRPSRPGSRMTTARSPPAPHEHRSATTPPRSVKSTQKARRGGSGNLFG